MAVRSGIWCLALLVSSPLSSAGARAGDRDEKERLAKKACLSGDYAKGVSLLTDLYVDTNDANYIFNQGRCFEQSNRCEEAIISFREYLRKTKDAGQVSDGRAERHIADCEELLRKAKGPTMPSPAASSPKPAPELPAPTTVATAGQNPGQAGPSHEAAASQVPAVVQASLPSLPSATPGRGLRIAGAVTFGVGVAAVAAGVGFALAANNLASELEASPSSYQRSKESTRASYASASTISYAAGGVCLAGGAVFYVLGWRQGRGSAATVQPMVSAQSMGVLVQGAF